MNIQDFPPGLIQRLQKDTKPPQRAPQTFTKSPRDRLTCLHWNPGGLSQSTWVEVKHWLQRNPVDLVVISETRWSFSSTWHDRAWLYVHSATQEHKSGGVLIMISRRIAEPEQIGYNAIVDGRLVHVRVHYDKRALDVLPIYQYVDNRTSHSATKRAQVWDALHQTLQNMPSRNNLLCAGDFNCALEEAPPWVGTTEFAWHGCRYRGTGHQDHGRLRDILQTHGLTAIDTWGSSGATYVHGDAASRIDHFLIRLVACDGKSKQVQFLYSIQTLFQTMPHTMYPFCVQSDPNTWHTRHLIVPLHAHMPSATNAELPDYRRHKNGTASDSRLYRPCKRIIRHSPRKHKSREFMTMFLLRFTTFFPQIKFKYSGQFCNRAWHH